MTPETTAEREGFIHAVDMKGSAAEMVVRFILRDFERAGLEAKGALVRQVCDAIAATEPRAKIDVKITPQYRNMRYWLEDDMTPVDLARDALRDIGIEPVEAVIRGGTDGSRLTEMGVPCPEPLHRHAERARAARIRFGAGHGPGHQGDAADRRARDTRLSPCRFATACRCIHIFRELVITLFYL
jgi:hypothetical protein